jgi:type I restriction enzyme S subunit
MKEGWEIKSLGEIADVEYGFTDKSVEEGDYRYVRITDIDSNGELIPTEKKYLKHSKEAEVFLIRDKDLLMARTGATFAKVLLYQDFEPSVFASYLIRINFKEKVDNKLYWYFTKTKSYWEQANSLASGAAQPHFNGAAVKQVVFSYPKSFQEQQRIVAILDDAFAKIEKAKVNAKQNIKNAQELFESYLKGVFEKKGDDWEERTLKEVCAKITDGTHQTPKYFDEGIIFLSSRNVTSGKIDWENIKYIDEKQHLEMHKRVAPRVGDILLAKNGTTGVAAIVDRDLVFDIYVSLAHIRVLDEVTPDFMLYFINSPIAKKQFNKRLKGSGVPNLHLEEIREVEISFPKSKKTQDKLVQKLNNFSQETKKLKTIYDQKIKDLEELKKSVLQKAFSGEL